MCGDPDWNVCGLCRSEARKNAYPNQKSKKFSEDDGFFDTKDVMNEQLKTKTSSSQSGSDGFFNTND
jgi:hypothetical protein